MVRRIGVLALQGSFAEHAAALRAIGAEPVQVRLPADLERVDALVLPGGESTTIGKLLVLFNLLDPLVERARAGLPMLATCAGMIVLAREVGTDQTRAGLLDLTLTRNGFGRQVASFVSPVELAGDPTPLEGVFIRAPVIDEVGAAAEPFARLPDGRVCGVRQGRILATSFHPELTADSRIHARFAAMIEEA
jgi:5'-phosphate synthase pdxT subunit